MAGKLVIMQGPEDAYEEIQRAAIGLVDVERAGGRKAELFTSMRDAVDLLDVLDVAVVLSVDGSVADEIEVRFFGGVSEEGPRVTEFEA